MSRTLTLHPTGRPPTLIQLGPSLCRKVRLEPPARPPRWRNRSHWFYWPHRRYWRNRFSRPTGSQGQAGTNGINGTNGVGFIFLGAWVSGNSYAVNDVVTENGNSYVETAATLPNDATDPATDTTNWSLIAQAGAMNARMIFPSFFPGNLSGTWTGGQVTIDQPITILRIAATAKTPTGSACPAAVFRFTDGTKGQDLVLAPGAYWSDTGPIVMTFAAGATLQSILRTGSTCAANTGADANLLVEYKMTAAGDTDTCTGTLCGTYCETTTSDPANCGGLRGCMPERIGVRERRLRKRRERVRLHLRRKLPERQLRRRRVQRLRRRANVVR